MATEAGTLLRHPRPQPITSFLLLPLSTEITILRRKYLLPFFPFSGNPISLFTTAIPKMMRWTTLNLPRQHRIPRHHRLPRRHHRRLPHHRHRRLPRHHPLSRHHRRFSYMTILFSEVLICCIIRPPSCKDRSMKKRQLTASRHFQHKRNIARGHHR